MPLALQAVAPGFAPPVDRPLTVTTERTETEGGDVRHYRSARTIRFVHEGSGWRADVTLLQAEGDAPRGAGAMFESAYGALAGKTIVFHLDAAGQVTGIDDADATWSALAEILADVALKRRAHWTQEERRTLVETIATPLRTLPPAQQRAMLGSLIEAVIEKDGTAQAGTTPVRIPGRSPLGGSTMLDGTRSVTRTQEALHVDTHAVGQLPVSDSGGMARIEISISHVSDPATGLLREGSDRTETRIGTGTQMRTLLSVTIVRVEAR